MGQLFFASPWLLAAAPAVVGFYLLLRLAPPPPRRVRLPSIKLLGLADEPPPPAGRPPLWLLLLRLGALTLLILGLAGPRWRPQPAAPLPDRLLLVIDNGWVAADRWRDMVAAARRHLELLAASGAQAALVATAPPPGGWRESRPEVPRFADAATALAALDALEPLPWPSERAAVAAVLPRGVPALWIADGVEDAGAAALRRALRRALGGGGVAVVAPQSPVIRMAGPTADGWAVQLVRPSGGPLVPVTAVARDSRGERLASQQVTFGSGGADADAGGARIRLPAARRPSLIELVPGAGAAATVLADGSGGRPRVAVIDGERQSGAPPLERGSFYVRRALEPYAETISATLDGAVQERANLLVLVDEPVPAGPLAQALLGRVRDGAVAISFAGPRIVENGSALSPVPLRAGGARALGGVLTWEKPQPIGGVAARSPLAGLAVFPDVTVSRQALARAEAPGVMRWAWLADGTPLVSARREGAGLLILFHTAVAPGWSTLPLTGALEAMLQRLLPLAADPAALDIGGTAPLRLERMLTAQGELVAPPVRAKIAAADWAHARPSPATPPGLYRSGDLVRPLNVAGTLTGPRFRFEPLQLDGLRSVARAEAAIELDRWLLAAAALLLGLDAFVALKLRGALVGRGSLVRAGLLAAGGWRRGRAAGPAHAVPSWAAAAAAACALVAAAPSPAMAEIEGRASASQAQVTIGYVRTGNARRDALSRDGLDTLGRLLTIRTAVAATAPRAVDPATDALGLYPVIYWPVASPAALHGTAVARVRDYIDRGGLILFDFTGDDPAGLAARALLRPLALPALEQLGRTHVLSRSFYLLEQFPGLRGAPAVWIEAGTRGSSGRVAGVVIGSADWAGAWSDESALPYRTRELAWRFGVNLVMYALTGTYKADQVHARSILDRLGRDGGVAPAP